MARLFAIAFATSSINFKHWNHMEISNNIRRVALPLQATSNPNPEQSKINYKLYAARRVLQLKNMYSPKTFAPCSFCDGTGFVDCTKCNEGCWRCSQTTLTKCHYCGGTGDSPPCFDFMPNNYEQENNVDSDNRNYLQGENNITFVMDL